MIQDSSRTISGRVLVVDDHAAARESIAHVLRAAEHEVTCCTSAVEAVKQLDQEEFDLVVTDLQMPGMSGLDLVKHVEQERLGVQIVVITAHASIATAVEAMRHGAYDYIDKPFDADRLEQLVGRAMWHGQLLDGPTKLGTANGDPVMIGSSPAMQVMRKRIGQIAPTGETVLVTGESGTGKELVARSVHAQSKRADAAMVSLNCPVLSEQLTESELFGHEKGAFTGADAARTGRFELADGGTILLDEVTEIALPLQAKLLRVLQEHCFERVGSSATQHVDVRVLATSNRDLRHQIERGEFREDLYYRLAVVPITVPPLRERREDIIELANHFLRIAGDRLDRDPLGLASSAADLLVAHNWPGNVRELENIVKRASVLCADDTIDADQLRPWLLDGGAQPEPKPDLPVGLSLEEMERKLIEATLERFDGHRQKTADALGIAPRTLSGKLRAYGYAPREKFAKAG
ncbi:MAG: sigma-54-dependent Fis family transcriptional regulator [Planctomycetales bacterium]|nr:sigma-54-dependent Fis family transcriptional regulator [Planctomycetales bacterium]